MCKVCREGQAVSIRWKNEALAANRVMKDKLPSKGAGDNRGKPIPNLASNSSSDWKVEFEEFIDNAEEGQEFIKHSVSLNDGDIEYIQTQCMQMDDIVIKDISRRSLHLLCDQEEGPKWKQKMRGTNLLKKMLEDKVEDK